MCGRAISPLKYTTNLTPKAGSLSDDKRPVLALPNYISSGKAIITLLLLVTIFT